MKDLKFTVLLHMTGNSQEVNNNLQTVAKAIKAFCDNAITPQDQLFLSGDNYSASVIAKKPIDVDKFYQECKAQYGETLKKLAD